MWSRLDDQLLDHHKLFTAGELLGHDGPAIALGFYAVGLMWVNRHLSDGHLPASVVRAFKHVAKPMTVADALTKAGLWEKNGSGFVIHDYHDMNPKAKDVKDRRKDRHRGRG